VMREPKSGATTMMNRQLNALTRIEP